MALLKTEPSRSVRTLEELFAIAHVMEHEAATRYAEIARRMRAEGSLALAEVFERLAAEERGHLDSVGRWSEKTKGRAPDPALVRWELPETFDDEGASAVDPRLLSAYRALSMAVRNEERAFAFWSYVAAHAGDAEIRGAAEAMAHEELDHVATLRRERRRAFHAERTAPAGSRADTAALERLLAERLERLAEAAGPAESARLRGFAEQARRDAGAPTGTPLAAAGGPASPGSALDDPVALAELLVDRYLEAAEHAADDAALALAQALAGRAIARLAWLRADLPEIG